MHQLDLFLSEDYQVTHKMLREFNLGLAGAVNSLCLKTVYPVSGAGYGIIAFAVHHDLAIVDSPSGAGCLFANVIESSDQLSEWCDRYPEKPFLSYVDMTCPMDLSKYAGKNLIFPYGANPSDKYHIKA